jgi:hypothetical protein
MIISYFLFENLIEFTEILITQLSYNKYVLKVFEIISNPFSKSISSMIRGDLLDLFQFDAFFFYFT